MKVLSSFLLEEAERVGREGEGLGRKRGREEGGRTSSAGRLRCLSITRCKTGRWKEDNLIQRLEISNVNKHH